MEKLPPAEELIQLYEEGESTYSIAKKFGANPNSVAGKMKRTGYVLRSPSECQKLAFETGRQKKRRYWKGKKQPAEMVARRAASQSGPNHWLWKGGKSKRDYRKVVKKVKCEECGGKLNLGIHHKDLDHYNNDPENLQVLCVSCHMSLHKRIYWDAVKAGKEPPRGNGPIGWER